ncbi:hypothetical protein HDU93_001041, partial [Gonapodya sp. JEL0774]
PPLRVIVLDIERSPSPDRPNRNSSLKGVPAGERPTYKSSEHKVLKKRKHRAAWRKEEKAYMKRLKYEAPKMACDLALYRKAMESAIYLISTLHRAPSEDFRSKDLIVRMLSTMSGVDVNEIMTARDYTWLKDNFGKAGGGTAPAESSESE